MPFHLTVIMREVKKATRMKYDENRSPIVKNVGFPVAALMKGDSIEKPTMP